MRTFTQSEKIAIATELLTDLDNLRNKAYRWYNHKLDEDERQKIKDVFEGFYNNLDDSRGNLTATISEYLAVSAEKFAAQVKEGKV